MEEVSEDIVRSLLVLGKSHKELSEELQQLYPDKRHGLSARSIRRYMSKRDKEIAVEEAVQEVSDVSVRSWVLNVPVVHKIN